MHSVPASHATVNFDTQLRTLAAQATTRYAGEATRIGKALVLALNGAVTLQADGTALVQSATEPEVQYQVGHGRCDCPDFARAPDGRCKHRFAVCLVKKARAALAPSPMTTQWYATYLSDERAQLTGIATYTAQGWVFQPDEGPAPALVTLRDLCLLGHVATADTQQAADVAARELAWEVGALWSAGQAV